MEQKSNSALIGSVIIVIIIIVGGVYLWKTSIKNKIEREKQPASTSVEVTEVSNLENDLNGLDVDNLDTDL